MGRMSLDTKPLNLSFPAANIEQMKAAAAAEHKTVSAYLWDLFVKSQGKKSKRLAVRS